MLEQELKVLISREQYDKVNTMYNWEDTYDQINFYYCAPGKEDIKGTPTIRIRSKKGHMELEVKWPLSSNEGSVKMHEEYSMPIDNIPYIIKAETLNKLLGRDDMEDVRFLGELHTNRRIYTGYKGTEIALDHNEYMNKEDYEVEVEYTDELPKAMLDELAFLDIDINKKTTGKYRRFIHERKI